jgi:ubiquinone/menaquinone biosynthesis C-methylase UbiE
MDSLIEQLKERIKDPDRYKSAAKQTQKAEKQFGKGKHGYSSVIPAPTTLEELDTAEKKLGFPLPHLLREIYSQVANGGFGPGYGLLGLSPNGATDDQGDTALTLSLGVEDPDNEDEYYWPDALLPICYYGDGIYACLDCSTENGTVSIWDSGELEDASEATSLREWLENWLSKDKLKVNNPWGDLLKEIAGYYSRYRYKYSPDFFRELAGRLQLDGQGRLLDLGCGTGQLTLPLAAYFEEAVGLDFPPSLLEQAALDAQQAGVKNVRWVEGSASGLPSLKESLGSFQVVTINDFNGMDQPGALYQLNQMVVPGGTLAIIETKTNSKFFEATEGWAFEVRMILHKNFGYKFWDATSQTNIPAFEKVLAGSRFSQVEVFEMEDTRYLTADEIIGLIYSESSTSKLVLRDRQAKFEQEIRQTLHEYNPADRFEDHIHISTILARRPS